MAQAQANTSQSDNSERPRGIFERLMGPSEPTVKELEEKIAQAEKKRHLDLVQKEATEKEALAFLKHKTYGKIIDKNYLAYCAALLAEFFNEKKVVDHIERAALLDSVIREHIHERLQERTVYDNNTILRTQEYNEEIQGVGYKYNWWNPFTKVPITIDERPLNSSTPMPRRPLFNFHHAIYLAIGVGAATLIGRYAVSLACSWIKNSFTTPSTISPQTVPLLTDTHPSNSTSISRAIFLKSIDISSNIASGVAHGVRKIISHLWPPQRNETYTIESTIVSRMVSAFIPP